jgi:hypothetical protein
LSRGKLVTQGARTDWPVVCWSCWGKAAWTMGSILAEPATVTWCVWGCCYSTILAQSCSAARTMQKTQHSYGFVGGQHRKHFNHIVDLSVCWNMFKELLRSNALIRMRITKWKI